MPISRKSAMIMYREECVGGMEGVCESRGIGGSGSGACDGGLNANTGETSVGIVI